jgi:hypothetical protein
VFLLLLGSYHASLRGQLEATRSEIQELWDSGNHQELESRLRYLSTRSSCHLRAVKSLPKEKDRVWDRRSGVNLLRDGLSGR